MLSDTAQRGQFVGKVTAIDPDISNQDKMRYAIISENKNQVSSIKKSSRILDLVNLHNCDQKKKLDKLMSKQCTLCSQLGRL